MPRSILSQALLGASALATAASPILTNAASAQDAPPVRAVAPATQAPAPRSGDYRNPPPPEPTAPRGYDGRDLPPPPADYIPPIDAVAQQEADRRYAEDAERWAHENCVKSKGDVGAGALVGGILGAIIGGSLGGRHSGGAAAGAIIGAVGGAAVASKSGGDTSPGCPEGYVVRRGAPIYVYAQPDYAYAAPGWYRPWVFVDGYWVYRPYPYHEWYYRTYRGPGPVYYGRPYGGPGYRPH